IYTVVEAVLLEPLPFEEPDELTLLWTHNEEQNQSKYMVSPLDFDDWRTQNNTFEAMAAWWPTTGTVTEVGGDPSRIRQVFTTEDYFDVLGATALLGRTFTPDEGPGSTPVAILSEGYWQRRFGGDRSVIGRTLTIDGSPVEIVGVIPTDQTFPVGTEVWTQMTWPMQIQSRAARWMSAMGRIQGGTDLEAARADMAGLASRLEAEHPDTNRGWTVTAAPLQDELVGDTGTALLLLLSATGLVLLIACANVANLLLSRSEVRAREIAVRVAFGAGRSRLVRQLLTESLVLAGAGALLGIGLGYVSLRGLLALAPDTLPRESTISMDGTVLAVVLGASLLTGLLFGLAPIVRLLKSDVHTTIRDGARSTSSVGGHRLQNSFVVAQLAMALMLVVGAGLLVQSFSNIRSVDTGFQVSDVLTFELDLNTTVAEGDDDVILFYDQLRQQLGELPGVYAVGDASSLPLGESLDYTQEFQLLDYETPAEIETRATLRPVSPGFFEAMRTPLVAGRLFDDTQRRPDAGELGVAVVNEAFVRTFYGSEDPLNDRVGNLGYRFGPLGAIHLSTAEIIGVVEDMKYAGLRTDPLPAIYVSGLQSSIRRRTVTVRTDGNAGGLLPAVRREVTSLHPTVALTNVQTMETVLADAQSGDRFSTLLLSLFGLVALLLASVGVYGVLAYAVEQRRGEVGIRMALGAAAADVRGMVLADGVRLVAVGLVLGLAGAFALSGVLASQLFGVSPRDPAIYASVAGILLVVGLVASFVPAWRATRVDPVVAMKAE
ncbi:MAG: ABC transporter permease, partial [Gemmatimonadetes bacterium]|nr:ABC transporter permease [Gemmatimonadota bacterium]